MAIRLRVVDGVTVALCAAKTDVCDGDIYLDDNAHYALMCKFAREWDRWSEVRHDMLTKREEDA